MLVRNINIIHQYKSAWPTALNREINQTDLTQHFNTENNIAMV